MSDVLADTGFWIALFDSREEFHEKAVEASSLIEVATLIVPWPILYETLRTRFVRRREWIKGLDDRLKKPNVVFVDDKKYCEDAYSLVVEHSIKRRGPISMVDMLCRILIADPDIHIDFLLTTNPRDFHDVCIGNRVEMLL